MTDEFVLEATGVAKRYGAVTALRDASLAVRPGEVHALMGANGAGKSTLVKILTGAIQPDAGSFTVRARAQRPLAGRARALGIACVYQEPSLIPDLDVRSNLRLTATPVGPFREWLVELGIPDLDLDDLIRDLPLPTLRIIDLARALAVEPSILLLDEMTAALPADLTERVMDVVGGSEAAPLRDLHLASADRDPGAVRPGDRPARRPTVGVLDVTEGAEERIVELMLGQVAREPRPPPRRFPGPRPLGRSGERRRGSRSDPWRPATSSATSRSTCTPARCSASSPSKARARMSCSRSCPAPTARRRARSRSTAAGRVRPPARRDPGGPPVRAGQPGRGAPHAAIGAREHRPPVRRRGPRAGARSTMAAERREGPARRRPPPDRHARGLRGPPPVGRQPAEGDDRALDRGGVQTLLCFDPTRGIDIRTKREIYLLAPRAGGERGRRAPVHLGARGDPARVRSGDRHLRRPGGRGAARGRGRRGGPAARRATGSSRTP